jgi:hypothetical protein
MDDRMRDRVVLALRSTNLELTCTGPAEEEGIIADLTRFSAIAAGGWTKAQKDEWRDAVLAELVDLPYLLVQPVLAEARRRVQFPGQLVTWIFAEVEPKMKRLHTERATYERLLEIADARDQ